VRQPGGLTASSQEFRRAFAAQRLLQVDRIVRELKVRASGWCGTNLASAVKSGIIKAAQQARDAGVEPDGDALKGSFSLIDRRTIEAFANDTARALHKAADSLGRRTGAVLRQTQQLGLAESEINRILAGGVIAGQPAQTIRDLREALRAVHGEQVEVN